MPDPTPDSNRQHLLKTPRPWAFGQGELTAGLRRVTGDAHLQIESIEPLDLPEQRPSIGLIRGLKVIARGDQGQHTFQLVLKEPRGTTRTGTAGVGLREASVYRVLSEHLPIRTPQLMAAHPLGDWLVLGMLPSGRPPEKWTEAEYRLAVQQLVALHDRFWHLGVDLAIYNWLSRPLDLDFDIYIQAAATGVENLLNRSSSALLARAPDLARLFGRLVLHADSIAAALQQAPHTLVHGDYWPGNLHVTVDGQLTVFDWQHTGIGPGVLDLVNFVQASRWWYAPLPLAVDQLLDEYRELLAQANGHSWEQADWEALWDYCLLWIFIAHWIDLVAAIPESLIEARLDPFEEIWLEPLQRAASRRQLPEA